MTAPFRLDENDHKLLVIPHCIEIILKLLCICTVNNIDSYDANVTIVYVNTSVSND